MCCQYVLVVVYLFSRWVEAFPCGQADDTTVAEKLLENVFYSGESQMKFQMTRGSLYLDGLSN